MLTTSSNRSNFEKFRSTEGDGVRNGEDSKPKDEEVTNRVANQEGEAPKQEGEFEAFEDSPGARRTNQNLIDAVETEAANRIANNSNRKNGPCLTGIFNPVTGKTVFGENFAKNLAGAEAYKQFVENAHPLIKERIRIRQEQIDRGIASKDPLFETVDKRAGGHSEIVALDKAIKAREAATGRPVTEADLGSFDLHNRHMPNNSPMYRCPNCSQITEGVNIVGGHR